MSSMAEGLAADPSRRSRRARDAIHTAARELVCELGYSRVTMEAIASRAGVGKQTIYRWWPSKAAIVLDVLVADHESTDGRTPLADTADLSADVRAELREIVSYLTDTSNDNLVRALTAEMQYDRALGATVHDQLLQPQLDRLTDRIRAAAPSTPSGDDVDPEIVAEQLVGPIFHRWLLRRAPLDDAYIEGLVHHVIDPLSGVSQR